MQTLNPFEEAVSAGLGVWEAGTRFLAAVSGGADSTAMLTALAVFAGERALVLRCFHVEHGIRPAGESRGDAAAVLEQCLGLGIPCKVAHVPPGKIARTAAKRGIGLEAAARFYRHALWNREARRMGAARVLVAHTRDDLLETVLMRVLRGSGPAGLAAMRRDNGSVLRPLLDLGRPEVLAYLAGRGVPFRTDSTNADPAFLRNRIRNALVPQLDGLFPGWKTGLLSLVQTQRRTAGFLSFFAESAVPWEAVPETPFSLSVSEEAFFSAPEIVREEALFLAADRILAGKRGGAETGQLRRESVRRFCETRKSADLGKIRAKVRQGRVVLELRGKDGVERGFSRLIKEPGLYKINGMTVRIRRHSRAETGIPAGAEGAVSVTLPLVLRPPFPDELKGGVRGFTALLAAEDAHGTAALIGRKGTITEILKGSRRKPQSGFCLEVAGSE